MKAAEFKNWMKSIEQMSSDQLRNHQEHELHGVTVFCECLQSINLIK